MPMRHMYTIPPNDIDWTVPRDGESRFQWEYDEGRGRLLTLYQKGKDRQWDSVERIDWSLEVDPLNPIGLPDALVPIAGSPAWERLSDERRAMVKQHIQAWQLSQFLHGEQAALVCSARIVDTVPNLDAKFYAATQTMDEARHAETYARFLTEKVGMLYPITDPLSRLISDTLSDSRWDMPYLGMQVLIEGLALAAFGVYRDIAPQGSLAKQLLTYIMQDEARHVAFGRIALKDSYADMTSMELAEREDFVIEGCHLMRDRLRGPEIWEHLGMDVKECTEIVDASEMMRGYRSYLFSRIVPVVKDIGLWSPRVQDTFREMGVLSMADADAEAMSRDDERIAEELDGARRAEVETTIDAGK
ncbi:ferritin-like domain-containing protein [Streptosporangiaceae bacterium NEAU-GS5]|nr:ferritin-like domain-containing protein [Streptosporangiaceae bacterium NEAU-GS5]